MDAPSKLIRQYLRQGFLTRIATRVPLLALTLVVAAIQATGARATDADRFEIDGVTLGMTRAEVRQALQHNGFKEFSDKGLYFRKPPEQQIQIIITYREGWRVHKAFRKFTELQKDVEGAKLFAELEDRYGAPECVARRTVSDAACTWTKILEERQETLRWQHSGTGRFALALIESAAPPPASVIADIDTPAKMYQLGQKLDRGENYSEAANWYRKAAEQGYAPAQYNLGNMYYFGQGVTQNYDQAERWFRKAASQGDAASLYAIGEIWATGKIGWVDLEKATTYFRAAERAGNREVARMSEDALDKIAKAQSNSQADNTPACTPGALFSCSGATDELGIQIWEQIGH